MSENTTVETPESQEQVNEAEVLENVKKAHFTGWTNQYIASGKTFDEAKKSYDTNNAQAENVIDKFASIRETFFSVVEKQN